MTIDTVDTASKTRILKIQRLTISNDNSNYDDDDDDNHNDNINANELI